MTNTTTQKIPKNRFGEEKNTLKINLVKKENNMLKQK